MSTNRLLITGATGFIGSALAKRAVIEGWRVRAVIRNKNRSDKRITDDVETVRVEDIDGDTDWHEALAGVDTVVHLAARVHRLSDDIADSAAAYRRVNTEGTLCLAEAASDAGCRRFVFLSTVKVLGETGVFDGASPGQAPEDPYGRSKFEAEIGLRRLREKSGLEIACIRPPLVYGPGVRANFLRLMSWIRRGVPLPLGAVHNRRSMVYVGNLVDAVMQCLLAARVPDFAYTVTDGTDVSTADLIRRIAGAMGVPDRLIAVPLPLLLWAGVLTGKSPEVRRLTQDLAVAPDAFIRDFGWRPPFTMTAGIQETVDWFMGQPQ